MRNNLVLEFWDRSGHLSINNKEYADYANKIVNEKLQEDISYGDVTTNSLIDKNKNIRAKIVSKQNGIIAGIEEISLILKNKKIKFIKNKKDGSKIKNNGAIIEISGNARKILSYERTLLNILQRMSGIATLTYNTKKLIKDNCFVSGTRKTLFPLIDKKAISVGGGLTHRLNLNDSMLIKDNHLKLLNGNIEKALKLANKNKKAKYIEIEVKNEKEALEAAMSIYNLKSKKLFAIMFDNMDASIIKNTIKKINNRLDNYNKKIKNDSRENQRFSVSWKSPISMTINKTYNYKNKKIILFEASGNINDKNILEYSKTGADVISLGFLTHSPKAFDMSLDIVN